MTHTVGAHCSRVALDVIMAQIISLEELRQHLPEFGLISLTDQHFRGRGIFVTSDTGTYAVRTTSGIITAPSFADFLAATEADAYILPIGLRNIIAVANGQQHQTAPRPCDQLTLTLSQINTVAIQAIFGAAEHAFWSRSWGLTQDPNGEPGDTVPDHGPLDNLLRRRVYFDVIWAETRAVQLRWQEFLLQIRRFNERAVESFHRSALLQPVPGLVSYVPRDPDTVNWSAATSEATLSRLNPGDSYPEATGRYTFPVLPFASSSSLAAAAATAARPNANLPPLPPIVTSLRQASSRHELRDDQRYIAGNHVREAAARVNRVEPWLDGLGAEYDGEETEEYDAAPTGPPTPQSGSGDAGDGQDSGTGSEKAGASQHSRKRDRSPSDGSFSCPGGQH